jgi:hypothetical protein
MRSLLFFLPCLLVLSNLQAQQDGQCGTSIEDQMATAERRAANVIASQDMVRERGVITYIPVHFHLVGDAAGEGRVKEYRVLDQLCEMNEEYLEHDIQFYFSPHPVHGFFDKSINDAAVYTTQTNFFTMQNRRHANAVNIYVTDEAAPPGGGGAGLTLAYYSSQRDWIVSRRDKINGNDNNNTLSHEVGHFFSLAHTFFGWEVDEQDAQNQPACFDAGDPGWPKAPNKINGVNVERVNGTNCTISGDGICDTPPDYNFGFCQNNCVAYSGPATDPLSEGVNPQVNNFMSYYNACSDFIFTQGQEDAMHADIQTSFRNYLDNTFAPSTTEIDPAINPLMFPTQNDTLDAYNYAKFEWNTVPGATHYLLEVDRASSFISNSAQSWVLTDTTYVVTNLEASKSYFWRVRPFNVYSTCVLGKSRGFRTPATSMVIDIAELSSMRIFPNPVDSDAAATLQVEATNNFDATVRILDASGRSVAQLPTQQIVAGRNNIVLPTQGLANGLYFVSMDSQQGRRTERLVLLR